MKICQIIIQHSLQFDNCVIDLTYPEGHPKAGEPLEKVCFIGPNGTGKTRILELVSELFYWVLAGGNERFINDLNQKNRSGFFLLKYKLGDEFHHFFKLDASNGVEINAEQFLMLQDEKLTKGEISDFFNKQAQDKGGYDLNAPVLIKNDSTICTYIQVPNFFVDIALNYDNLNFVPEAQLSQALDLLKNGRRLYHIISPQYKNDFWTLLIAMIKSKESLILQLLQKNKKMSYEAALQQLDENYPPILEKIAALWDKILTPLNLYFDVENAIIPIQLTDNLLVYIKDKKHHKNVPYHLLSSGIQNFIFNLGHLLVAHTQHSDKNSLVLIDEPEDSLHPKFLYGIVDLYKEITGGEKSQLFVATHSEVVAAQFEPYERVILDFDPEKFGTVIAKKGISPKGQNASEVLMNDFGTDFYQHDDAKKAFDHFVELKNLIRNTENEAEKAKYVEEAENLAFKYRFPTYQKRQKI